MLLLYFLWTKSVAVYYLVTGKQHLFQTYTFKEKARYVASLNHFGEKIKLFITFITTYHFLKQFS